MAKNPEGANQLATNDADNEVLKEADDYLRQHKILELFEVSKVTRNNFSQDLTTMLAYKQPENLEGFLIETLKQRKVNGNRSIVYTDSELQNIYSLYDLKGSGFISPEVCKEGK